MSHHTVFVVRTESLIESYSAVLTDCAYTQHVNNNTKQKYFLDFTDAASGSDSQRSHSGLIPDP